MEFRHSFAKHARRAVLPVSLCALIIYFLIQLYVGDTGLPTNLVLRAELSEAKGKLAELHKRREKIEQNLSLIDLRLAAPPLLDDFARDVLKLVEADEIVVLEP